MGKFKFEPMRSQVLPSNEISGSLRKLKPTSFLAKERWDCLQPGRVCRGWAQEFCRRGGVIGHKKGGPWIGGQRAGGLGR